MTIQLSTAVFSPAIKSIQSINQSNPTADTSCHMLELTVYGAWIGN
jgi:hypothetical protein